MGERRDSVKYDRGGVVASIFVVITYKIREKQIDFVERLNLQYENISTNNLS